MDDDINEDESGKSGMMSDSIKFGLAEAVRAGVVFALFPFAALFFSPAELGVVAVIETIGLVVSLFVTLGIPESVPRLFFGHEDAQTRESFLSTLARFSTGLLFVIPVILISGGSLMWETFFSDIPFGYVVLAVVLFSLERHCRTFMNVYQAEGRAGSYLQWGVAFGVANLSLVVPAVSVLELGAMGWFGGRFVATGIVWIGLTAANRNLFFGGWQTRHAKNILVFALPVVPHLLNTQILYVADRLFLEEFETLAAVGTYSLFYNFGLIVFFLTTSLQLAWAPRFFAVAEKELDSGAMGIGNLAIFSAIAAAAIALVPFIEGGAALFFAQHRDGLALIPWINVAYVFHAAYSIWVLSILHSRKTVFLVTATGIAALSNITLNLFLIPDFGMQGAAIATVASFGISALLTASFAHRVHRIRRFGGRWLGVLALIGLATSWFVVTDYSSTVDILVSAATAIAVAFLGRVRALSAIS